MPSPKTVNIASGIYFGEFIYDSVKNKPILEKAYKLAEQKLDELLNESTNSKEEKTK